MEAWCYQGESDVRLLLRELMTLLHQSQMLCRPGNPTRTCAVDCRRVRPTLFSPAWYQCSCPFIVGATSYPAYRLGPALRDGGMRRPSRSGSRLRIWLWHLLQSTVRNREWTSLWRHDVSVTTNLHPSIHKSRYQCTFTISVGAASSPGYRLGSALQDREKP